jgi:hypothetical protein
MYKPRDKIYMIESILKNGGGERDTEKNNDSMLPFRAHIHNL